MFSKAYSLEEILFAVDAVAPAEALLGQLRLAVAALEALAVPVAVQHFEDEAVHDVLVAARAHWDLCRRRARWSVWSVHDTSICLDGVVCVCVCVCLCVRVCVLGGGTTVRGRA